MHTGMALLVDGEYVGIDVHLAAQAADIRQQQAYIGQQRDLFAVADLAHKLPPAADSETIAGFVTAAASAATGLAEGTPVAIGAGDVPATVTGASALEAGMAMAVLGTTYTQALALSGPAWAGAVGCGLLSTALLMANNVRDIPTDRETGKMTLAVRLGDTAARWSYVVMVAVAVVLPLLFTGEHPWLWLVLLAGAVAVRPSLTMLNATERRDLIPVLKLTGILGLVYAVLFSVGLLL